MIAALLAFALVAALLHFPALRAFTRGALAAFLLPVAAALVLGPAGVLLVAAGLLGVVGRGLYRR